MLILKYFIIYRHISSKGKVKKKFNKYNSNITELVTKAPIPLFLVHIHQQCAKDRV